MAAKITKIGPQVCRPFTLDVMVMNPSADFKFTLSIEVACSPQADQIWKLVFDLYKEVLKTFSQVILERGMHSIFFPGGTRSRSGAVERKLKLGLAGTMRRVGFQAARQFQPIHTR